MSNQMEVQVAELEKFAQEWADAELRGDTAFLGTALSDDFVGIGPHGFMLSKEQWLARYESADLRHEAFQFDETQVRLYGSAAVMTGRQTQSSQYRGHDVDGGFRATLVFVEQQDRWLLTSIHLSFIAEDS